MKCVGLLSSTKALEPPELHRGVLQGLRQRRVDQPLQLGDLVQQLVDPLAGLGARQGGGEARALSVELVQLEEAGLEALFERGRNLVAAPSSFILYGRTSDPVAVGEALSTWRRTVL